MPLEGRCGRGPVAADAARAVIRRRDAEVPAEGRVPDLGVGALQLAARGGDAAGDVVQGELGRVLALHDRGRILEQARSEGDGGGSLRGHVTRYAPERGEG